MEDVQQLYSERLKRIQTAFMHKEPDIVPCITDFETWAVGYAGKKSCDILGNAREQYECFKKVLDDIYFDGVLMGFLTRDVRMYEPLGNAPYFYAEDGVAVQHKECCYMSENDYSKLIADPMGYTVNEYYKLKYPSFNKPYPESMEALKKSFAVFNEYIQIAAGSSDYYRETLGLPVLPKGIGVMPVDLIMDYYRGLKNTLADIRRRPQQVTDAAEALLPISLGDITKGETSLDPYPYVFFPLHIPTYLSPKQFEKIYWPSFYKMLNILKDMGANVAMVIEGNWEHLYDYINQLPKNFAMCFLDEEDVIKAKKEIGDTVAICGGHNAQQLKYLSEQQCIDIAKEFIDNAAPGGGYMYTTATMLLGKNDINPQNLKAVTNFIHEYGRY